MRNKFAECLTQLAKTNEDICLLYADIGNRLFNNLKEIAPDRTINAGIAEANMATMASGMAQMGFRPFIYTITPFTTARNFEQIKIDLAYANVPVVIVGTGSGLAYANLGPTHHSFEDIALMRVLPNMKIVCPADSMELEALMPELLKETGPVYLRIGKKNEPQNYSDIPKLTVGKAHLCREGQRVTLLCTGTALHIGNQVADELLSKGISAELVSMHTVKPLDTGFLSTIPADKLVVSIEEHSLNGGFGSALCEWFNDSDWEGKVLRFGIPDTFIDQLSGPQAARDRIGLTAPDITSRILKKLSL
ncbi:transketolase [Alteromonadaceae bacterium M269]|nr:transketolase [Alteromonadaceae bacterium M269]